MARAMPIVPLDSTGKHHPPERQPSEVKHFVVGTAPVVRIIEGPGNKQWLEHLLTGEIVELKACSHKWILRFHDGWGLIRSRGLPPKWVNDELTESIWETQQGYVVRKIVIEPDGRRRKVSTVPLSSKSQSHKFVPLRWKAHGDIINCEKLTVTLLSTRRTGCMLFWSLTDLQDLCNFETKTARATRWITDRMGNWERMLIRIGLPTSHFLRPTCSTRGTTSGEKDLQYTNSHSSSASSSP